MSSPSPLSATNGVFRTYRRADAVVVRKTTEAFGGLSNMAAGYPLVVNGVRIPTAEALYQACRFPRLPNVQRDIVGQRSPMTAKMKSRAHHGETRPDWDGIRYKVMRWCLRAKLAQHYETFGRLLLATGQRPIVEQSRKDVYWGARASSDDATLVGRNVLGRLLMELRERLHATDDASLRIVEPMDILDFHLFGEPIRTIDASSNVTVLARQVHFF